MAHRLVIKDWRPVSVNKMLASHWTKRRKVKRFDADLVKLHALTQCVPIATNKRRVSVIVRGPWAMDFDNVSKSLMDALVTAGLLVDDGPDWLEVGSFESRKTRGEGWTTEITLEDVQG